MCSARSSIERCTSLPYSEELGVLANNCKSPACIQYMPQYMSADLHLQRQQSMMSTLPTRPMSRTDSGLGQTPVEEDVSTHRKGVHQSSMDGAYALSISLPLYHQAASQPLHSRVASAPESRRQSVDSSSVEAGSRPRMSRSDSKTSSASPRRSLRKHGAPRPLHSQRAMSASYVPLVSHDIAELTALHERSCRLFQSVPPDTTQQSNATNEPPPTSEHSATHHGHPSQHPPNFKEPLPPVITSLTPTMFHASIEGEDAPATYHIPSTVTHWTSQASRQRQYAKIDRSTKGLRGFWRKLAPRWCVKRTHQEFYKEEDGSDAGSVRRYRLEPDDDWHEKSSLFDEELSARLERAQNCLDFASSKRAY